MDLMRETARFAEKHGAFIQSHLSENKDEVGWIQSIFPERASYTDVYGFAGLLGGFAMWAYTSLLPAIAISGWAGAALLESGPWGIAWLKPTQLFGLVVADPATHAMLWSMIVNIGLYAGVSVFSRSSATEQVQAAHFVDVYA